MAIKIRHNVKLDGAGFDEQPICPLEVTLRLADVEEMIRKHCKERS